eukprot:CAMPEP_0195261998 /NCGR_PEP_ID=MMETSP0706-20130129/9495_1 /TAXON_ID=33640 /ORGANISM="Asterionellopsis glacialis, Strain CCMP134" /LENGTH=1208 /DNA_ID=CAMNT_0040315999 /DNA_START=57 /DNA_END=3683 /DNA_ORIENTATION=+
MSMGFSKSVAVLAALVVATNLSTTEAHGHLTSPRSRNWYAAEEGMDGLSPDKTGVPKKEFCPHCLNTNEGVCGISPSANGSYDDYLDSNGAPMPWISQGTYSAGGSIIIKSYLDTHHNGHMEIFACPNGPASDMACFLENPLHFVKDLMFDMPADPAHPERGYYYGGQGGGEKSFEMEFKLPDDVVGDQVMLHWRYITANSCSPPGYSNYFSGVNSKNEVLPDSFWTAGVSECTPPYPDDGTRSTTWPEQFFNCAEITVTDPVPTISPQPTLPPVTQAPATTPAPVAPQPMCCSDNMRDCVTYCGTTEAECSNCNKHWIQENPGNCKAMWDQCNSDPYGCCPGLTCVYDNPDYSQCRYVEPAPTTAPPPVVTPTWSSPTWAPPSPTMPTPTNPPPSPTMPAPTTDSGEACCTIDFKNCSPTVQGYCSTSEQACTVECDKFWLPNGAITGCLARWEACSTDAECCSPGICLNGQCMFEKTWNTPTAPPVTQAPVLPPTNPSPTIPPPTPSPVTPPTNPTPTNPPPPVSTGTFSCSDEVGKSSWEALLEMQSITNQISPTKFSVLSSGGAAGDGSSVVSESQAYGVLTAAMALLSMDEGDPNYEIAKNWFYAYFNGWKQMCENSNPAACQQINYCNYGSSPCLPGWKHDGALTEVQGTGAAPDGDEDSIVGMIIALKAVENDANPPSWYNEVHDWADASCTQFLVDNTALSTSGNHLLLKLGTCWGGWDSLGNNPSYHAPGHYRMMRDFQASITSRSYSVPGGSNTLSDRWNKLIDTSYKFLETTQCPDSGLVPNWALVQEQNDSTLAKFSGSFSGSGTPQYEFGSEASRTMWRIAFDAAAYPVESAAQSRAFLEPLHQNMVDNFNPEPINGWEYFGDQTLQDCSSDPGYVSNVFGSWMWNGFIFGPVYSTLISQIPTEKFNGKSFNQQTMIDKACLAVDDMSNLSYYPLSWQVIAKMTLNGDVALAGELFNGPPAPTALPSPTQAPQPTLPPPVTSAPVAPPPVPTAQPPPTNGGPMCCSQNFKDCVSWCGTTESECTSCNADVHWIPEPQGSCMAKHADCTNNQSGCCSGLTCVEDSPYYRQCRYVANTTPPPTSPPVMPPVTQAPVTQPPVTQAPVTQAPVTQAPVTQAPVTQAPVPAPTQTGCYSNNWKDCNVQDNQSCDSVFLTSGALSNCIALWGECTGLSDDDCCSEALCLGDGSYAQCVPPS